MSNNLKIIKMGIWIWKIDFLEIKSIIVEKEFLKLERKGRLFYKGMKIRLNW